MNSIFSDGSSQVTICLFSQELRETNERFVLLSYLSITTRTKTTFFFLVVDVVAF
jgi:hypothetical protein